MSGRVVGGRFALEEKVAEGGMGIVWRARDTRDGSTVAVKLVSATTDETRERFLREAGLLATLTHANIVRYIDSGPTGDRGENFLAMEWLVGEDFEARLRRPISPREALRIVATAAEALGAAHRRGIVHRDVKPSNVFVTSDGAVKVLDFGVARLVDPNRVLTRGGALVGTPGYMAPEQIRGEAVDARADVFSLGCVLFEALTSRPPFFAEHPVALLFKILIEEPPTASELAPGIPPLLDAFVTDSMSKDASRRPADGNAFATRANELARVVDDTVRLSVARTDRPASLTGAEKRVVCIVVVAGNAELAVAKTLHAEAAAAEVQDVARIVSGFGGRVEALPSGARVIVFGGARGIRDQAESAARCALAVARALPMFSLSLAMGFAEIRASRLPIGEVLDRAVRLAFSAAPGTIRADDVALGLLDAGFSSSDHLLTGERERALDAPTLLGKTTPLVGRNLELVGLLAIVDETVADAEARSALVVGPAGIGKSRLRYELARRLGERHDVVWSAGSTSAVAAPFDAMRGLVRSAAGVGDRGLHALVSEIHVPEPDRVGDFLGELIGAAGEVESVQLHAARHDPMRMGDQIRRALDDLFLAACTAKPLVVLLDDMQWADKVSVQILGRQLRTLAGKPLVVIGFARPDVDEVLEGAWKSGGLVRMALSGLSRRAATQLVLAVLPALPEDRVEGLVTRADGNAFLLEELVREAAQGRFESLPITVLAMVQGRFEALPPRARRVLRAASVYGAAFERDAIVPLMRDMPAEEVDVALGELEAAELVARAEDGRVQFRQPLLRDAAYGTLTDTDKLLGHRLAGRWLRDSNTGASAREIASHLDRGADVEGAVPMLTRALEECLAGNDYAEVEVLAERIIALGASGAALGAVLAIRAEANAWAGRDADAERIAHEALELLAPGSRRWLEAVRWAADACARVGHLGALDALAVRVAGTPPAEAETEPWVATTARVARHLFLTGNPERGQQLLVAAELAAGPLENAYPLVRAPIHSARAMRAMVRAELATTVVERELCAQQYVLAGEMRTACVEYINLGEEWAELGLLEKAEAALRIGLQSAERMAMPSMIAFARATLAGALVARGEKAEATRLLRETIGVFAAGGHKRLEGASRARLALVVLDTDPEEARAQSAAALEVLSDSPLLLPLALAAAAEVARTAGDTARALDLASQASDRARLSGVEHEGAFVALVHARALLAAGKPAEALAAAHGELTAVERRAATIADVELRESFLSRGKDHQALRALVASLS